MRFSFRHVQGPTLALACALLLHGGACAPVRAADGVMIAQDEPDQPAEDPASASALLVRVDRLENKVRTLTGQIQELQFQNKRLDDALRKMQQDVDFRFQELSRAPTPPGGKPPLQKRGDLGDGTAPDHVADAAPTAPVVTAAPDVSAAPPAAPPVAATKPDHRGDAFDPATDPNAPGAPKPLGTTPPSAPLRSTLPSSGTPAVATRAPESQPHAPLDLLHGAAAAPAQPAPPAAPADGLASLEPAPAGGPATRGDYEAGYAAYKGGQYDAAVATLQDFIQKHPNDRLVPDATYFLGESYQHLGRQREAAEQFLKMSTDYNRSTRAPDALLRLGVALNALGAKDQACAIYQEVGRKYPSASPDVRAGVERELKRSRC